jgi:predicted nucleotide-binding protein
MGSVKRVKAALKALKVTPVILMESASLGKTVIEKFESVSESCDIAVVIVSPDDVGQLAGAKSKPRFRTRQNVLFELGYFYGVLGRRNGKVILLECGDVEIPSDLAGIVRIDGKLRPTLLKKVLRLEIGKNID